ncbi:MAG: transposase, partial [Gemmataceae bacterium]
MHLTTSFAQLLVPFCLVFTAPTFQTFTDILTGWILTPRRRFLTEVIYPSDNLHNRHWSRFYRFFSHAKWDVDYFSATLARIVVRILAPDALLLWAVDDTLAKRRGLTIFGAAMHYDPLISSKNKKLVSYGHDWVVLCLLIVDPFWARGQVFALPMAMRLYQNRQGNKKKKKKTIPKDQADSTAAAHKTRPELAVELISLVSEWFAEEEHMILGDSAYGGQSVLSHQPENVHWISQVHPRGALYKPAGARQKGQRGPNRKKGDRLPTKQQWAADEEIPWQELEFDQFGLHAHLAVKTQKGLYYKAGGQRLLPIVLTRDLQGQRPDMMFYCTKLDWSAYEILSAYASRWSIDISHAHCRSSARWVTVRFRSYRMCKRVAAIGPLVPTTSRQSHAR